MGSLLFLFMTSCNNNQFYTTKPVEKTYYITGEITNPGTYEIPDTSVTICDAITKAGDMTVFGMRNKVKIYRLSENNKRSKHVINLNQDISNSPYYTIKSGDIIYITPNKMRTESQKIGRKSTLWVSLTSFIISTGTFLLGKLK